MIVVIGGQKGGTGKTTIAVNLAAMRAAEGRDILLFDMDEQLTSTLWASTRDNNKVTPRIPSIQKILDERTLSPGAVIRNELKALKPKYQDIIVDAGGAANEVLRAAITLADIIIFPLMPSEFDMWTLGKLNDLIAACQDDNHEFKAKIVISKVSTNQGAAKKEITDFDDFLKDFEHLKRCENVLYLRKPIRTAAARGKAISEHKPSDEQAIEEFSALYKELFNGGN